MLGGSTAAEKEFLQVADHRGLTLNSALGVLGSLQLAKICAMNGKIDQAGVLYRHLSLDWKDADPDSMTLRAARAGYASLHRSRLITIVPIQVSIMPIQRFDAQHTPRGLGVYETFHRIPSFGFLPQVCTRHPDSLQSAVSARHRSPAGSKARATIGRRPVATSARASNPFGTAGCRN
jgi:hypothetical protein